MTAALPKELSDNEDAKRKKKIEEPHILFFRPVKKGKQVLLNGK